MTHNDVMETTGVFHFEVRTRSWEPMTWLATEERAMAKAYCEYYNARGEDLEIVTVKP